MTHTPEAIRAAELANAMVLERYEKSQPIYRAETFEGQMAESSHIAFTRYIRTVSDAVEAAHSVHQLRQFILPKPVDPLADMLKSEGYYMDTDRLRKALDAAGFEIVRKGGLPTPGEK